MKKIIFILTCFLYSTQLISQEILIEDYGCKHLAMLYKKDTVDILVKMKKGDEQKKKPIFLFCQGSMPVPLAIFDKKDKFPIFPFNADSLSIKYHIVVISKPTIPVLCNIEKLNNKMEYVDVNGNYLQSYQTRNYLDYYVNRNVEVLKYLQNQSWFDQKKLIVAGHSEGSFVASKLAMVYPKITHLIYSGGAPYGRIMSMLQKDRMQETDSNKLAEQEFDYWKYVLGNKNSSDNTNGDSPKNVYQYSIPAKEYLDKLKIPVLICYGTKDIEHSVYNDLFRVETIRRSATNFTFLSYIGLEHNFFPVDENGKTDWNQYNWENVGYDWMKWLESK